MIVRPLSSEDARRVIVGEGRCGKWAFVRSLVTLYYFPGGEGIGGCLRSSEDPDSS